LLLLLAVPALAFGEPPPAASATPASPIAGMVRSAPKFSWPAVPKASQAVAVPGILVAQGVPLTLQAFKCNEKMDPLVRFFYDSFSKAGLYIAPPKAQPQISSDFQLTALDPDAMMSYTVVFQENRDGTTTVILADTNLGAKQPSMGPDFAPLFPGAKGIVRTNVEGAKTLAYAVAAKEEEIRAFYKETLEKAGFRKGENGEYLNLITHEEISIRMEHDKKGGLNVGLIWRRSMAVETPGLAE
jgi:hypothetical protein